mmetsp:Transcript_44445/g.96405  ORF Transcript_44445/g.96405 Transcript_44445/m.96405 type:complete len:215 (-) Transcript_44445:137-781(-)
MFVVVTVKGQAKNVFQTCLNIDVVVEVCNAFLCVEVTRQQAGLLQPACEIIQSQTNTLVKVLRRLDRKNKVMVCVEGFLEDVEKGYRQLIIEMDKLRVARAPPAAAAESGHPKKTPRPGVERHDLVTEDIQVDRAVMTRILDKKSGFLRRLRDETKAQVTLEQQRCTVHVGGTAFQIRRFKSLLEEMTSRVGEAGGKREGPKAEAAAAPVAEPG